MQEIKKPKKPIYYYYGIVMLALLLFNFLLMPWAAQRSVEEVGYNQFMDMTEDHEIGRVEIEENQILFTDKDEEHVYKTDVMEDPELVDRLHEADVEFTSEIIEQMSPLTSFLLSWVLPIVIFIALGQYMSSRLMKNAGGKNSMMFGMGKSNAKIYVKSSDGIKFSDVAGEDEAKENLSEIVEYLHDPKKYKEIGASMPKGILLVGPPGTGRRCWPKPWQEKRMCRFSLSLDLSL